jgi:transcription elongation GreA/GreB family factor
MSIIFTKKEFEELKKSIEEVERKLKEIIQQKSEAFSGQDSWHDEGFKLGIVEEMTWSKRLRELQELLSKAEIVEPEEQNEYVRIGTGVVIEYEDGSIKRYIVEGYTVTTTPYKLSIYSPLGKVLLNAKVGDERILNVGGKRRKLIVKEIIPPSKVKEIFSELEKDALKRR